MRDNIISFPIDPPTRNVVAELQRRFTLEGAGAPVSRSFTIRWAIRKCAEHYFNSAEFRALMKGEPLKARTWKPRKKKRSAKAKRGK